MSDKNIDKLKPLMLDMYNTGAKDFRDALLEGLATVSSNHTLTREQVIDLVKSIKK